MATAEEICEKHSIGESDHLIKMSYSDGISNILDCIQEFDLDLKLEVLDYEELSTLLTNYVSSIFDYHNENYHQERGALLRSWDIMTKHGLTDEDYKRIDFS